MDSDDEQLLRGWIHGADHDHPGPKPGRSLAELVQTSPAQHTTRDADEPGVRLRCYLDLRQPISPATLVGGLPPVGAAAPRRRACARRTPAAR
ncbi:DUF6207 family protein [Streptomyces sp. NPDC001480]|uniref:DUF6207 family protein n=1 Tax=Streptomyces sp. NPDC001480 TaxID=3364577 RepID=UPI0036CA5D06